MDLEAMTIIIEAIDGYEEFLDSARGVFGKQYLSEEPTEDTAMGKVYQLYRLIERFSPLYNGEDESINKIYEILWNREVPYEERAKLILGL
ncbi:hypothetical protein [Pseudobutyrivibrio ruminis]|uniref:Uncharacterized protein n=1 Tax=Pseudobutyrivibrio ruminis DSM 9787 TaxID=1123011 RepID=A0A285T8R3_9FIRM|nr:hypothetical protein [Pseudobutyrivibrio ruminis]SOC17849.1 hypothetical protein SAMN02910411_0546 [Pseudobutyrivibrio ruminis DSM 9787]